MKVLFVEDDALNRRVVKDMLQLVSAELVEAEDAEIGLAMVEQHVFDVVLMDLRMPGMDGMTAIRHIRDRDDAKRGLPIIVITADQSPNLHTDCMVGGADAVLLKPVSMQELFDTIGRVIADSPSANVLPL